MRDWIKNSPILSPNGKKALQRHLGPEKKPPKSRNFFTSTLYIIVFGIFIHVGASHFSSDYKQFISKVLGSDDKKEYYVDEDKFDNTSNKRHKESAPKVTSIEPTGDIDDEKSSDDWIRFRVQNFTTIDEMRRALDNMKSHDRNRWEKYITKVRQSAIEHMHKSHIPASVTIAQAILESGCGGSGLATEANNHFGIKCIRHCNSTQKRVYKDGSTSNEASPINGKSICCRRASDDSHTDHFVRYPSLLASIEGHTNLLLNSKVKKREMSGGKLLSNKEYQRYGGLFLLGKLDYRGWCVGLSNCGYATSPTYAEKLIAIIESFELNKYDNE